MVSSNGKLFVERKRVNNIYMLDLNRVKYFNALCLKNNVDES